MNRALLSLLSVAAVSLAVPALAEEPAGGEGDELAGAGKVIEVAPDGTSTVVKGEEAEQKAEAKADPKSKGAHPSLAEACRVRFAAQCKAIKRCMGGSAGMPLPCEEMTSMCDQVQGEASYTRKQLEACAKGLASLKCNGGVDPANPASFQLESRVPACKPVVQAEAAQGGGTQKISDGDAKGAAELQRQLNQALGGH